MPNLPQETKVEVPKRPIKEESSDDDEERSSGGEEEEHQHLLQLKIDRFGDQFLQIENEKEEFQKKYDENCDDGLDYQRERKFFEIDEIDSDQEDDMNDGQLALNVSAVESSYLATEPDEEHIPESCRTSPPPA